jgi:hypothetical protein
LDDVREETADVGGSQCGADSGKGDGGVRLSRRRQKELMVLGALAEAGGAAWSADLLKATGLSGWMFPTLQQLVREGRVDRRWEEYQGGQRVRYLLPISLPARGPEA